MWSATTLSSYAQVLLPFLAVSWMSDPLLSQGAGGAPLGRRSSRSPLWVLKEARRQAEAPEWLELPKLSGAELDEVVEVVDARMLSEEGTVDMLSEESSMHDTVIEGDDDEAHEAPLPAGFGGTPWRQTPESVLTAFCHDERV